MPRAKKQVYVFGCEDCDTIGKTELDPEHVQMWHRCLKTRKSRELKVGVTKKEPDAT